MNAFNQSQPSQPICSAEADTRYWPHAPSLRGRVSGGREPTGKVSGSVAAHFMSPPFQPSMALLHSMPLDMTPPTAPFFTTCSSNRAARRLGGLLVEVATGRAAVQLEGLLVG